MLDGVLEPVPVEERKHHEDEDQEHTENNAGPA
jgi:hypothetical protein